MVVEGVARDCEKERVRRWPGDATAGGVAPLWLKCSLRYSRSEHLWGPGRGEVSAEWGWDQCAPAPARSGRSSGVRPRLGQGAA